jgi:drug/metabolite transporter (DMT)-like permease
LEPEIAGLVLLSAAFHPLWNALVKRDPRPEGAFVGLMAALAVLALVHSLAAGSSLDAILAVWPLAVVSAAGQLLYGVCLVATLKRGDLSAYYPIIRSSPLFVVAFGILFLGEVYGGLMLAGVAAVLLGAFQLQHRPGARLLDDPLTLSLAGLALCGTGIYSIADSRIVRTVAPEVLLFWVQLACIPAYALAARALGGAVSGRGLLGWLTAPRHLLLGAVCYASYFLILTAFRMGGEVAAVTTVRQASIPLSVVIGGWFLGERLMRRRLPASLLVAGGIATVVLAR